MADDDADGWDAAQEGAERIAEGDLQGAIDYLTSLAEREPHNAYAHFFLGAAFFELAEYVKALRSYLSALEQAPDYVGAMIATGQTLRMLGRYPEAIRMGRQVLSRSPDDPDALFLLGACHFARGDEEAAARYLKAFIASGPEIEAAIEAQGMLQVLAGQIIEHNPEDDDV
ncbi:MAG: tetratricopeptide repeat protein, partial [Myxococcales bacterium]|nr:tetratricopeptide repeat protein [Myxococcales bacterium]